MTLCWRPIGGSAKFSRGGIGAFIKRIPVRVLIEDSDARVLPDLSASADVVISSGQSGPRKLGPSAQSTSNINL